MNKVLEFLSNNWETLFGTTGGVVWLLLRLIPTKRNIDPIEGILKGISKLIPNRKKDSLGNKSNRV